MPIEDSDDEEVVADQPQAGGAAAEAPNQFIFYAVPAERAHRHPGAPFASIDPYRAPPQVRPHAP